MDEDTTKINIKDYKYVVAFNDTKECYLCEDMDEVDVCVKEGLNDNPGVEAYVLTFTLYKKASYKVNYT